MNESFLKPIIELQTKLEDAAKIMADLMFAYINKDIDCPHDFEVKAFEEAVYFLQEFYTDNIYTVGMFEEALNQIND